MGKKYFWLKLKEDFFDRKEIKHLRKIAGGDTYTIIYLKLLLKSLKTEGFIYFESVCEDFIGEIALDIDEDPENVNITVNYLKMKNLLEVNDHDDVLLKELNGMVGSETDSAERVRRLRDRRNTNDNLPKVLQSNGEVTKCNIEIEKEIEIEIEKDTYTKTSFRYESALSLFHEYCFKMPRVQKLTDPRKRILKSWGDLEEMKLVFEKAGKSAFLNGSTGWKANFDWVINPKNRVKILEGNYDDEGRGKVKENVTSFNDYAQRKQSYDEFEIGLLGWDDETP